MSRAFIVTPEAEADILDGYRSYDSTKGNGLKIMLFTWHQRSNKET
jgi:hypothetical protein